jgi:hypothetical protein
MNLLKSLVMLSLVAAWCSAAWADIPPPRRQENERIVSEVAVKFRALRGERPNVQAKIIIPSYLVGGGRDVGKIAPSEEAPAPKAAPKPEKQSSLGSPSTIIAGIAMSLAAASIVFLVRGSRTTKTAALVALAAAGALGGYSVAWADVAQPGSRGEPVIVIELSDEADIVTLLMK